jgi:hypothetical protein
VLSADIEVATLVFAFVCVTITNRFARPFSPAGAGIIKLSCLDFSHLEVTGQIPNTPTVSLLCRQYVSVHSKTIKDMKCSPHNNPYVLTSMMGCAVS